MRPGPHHLLAGLRKFCNERFGNNLKLAVGQAVFMLSRFCSCLIVICYSDSLHGVLQHTTPAMSARSEGGRQLLTSHRLP